MTFEELVNILDQDPAVIVGKQMTYTYTRNDVRIQTIYTNSVCFNNDIGINIELLSKNSKRAIHEYKNVGEICPFKLMKTLYETLSVHFWYYTPLGDKNRTHHTIDLSLGDGIRCHIEIRDNKIHFHSSTEDNSPLVFNSVEELIKELQEKYTW